MKKFISICLLVCLLAGTAVYGQAAENVYENDGLIVLSGKFPEARKGSIITLTVADQSLDWTNEADWGEGNENKIQYYSDTEALDGGVYEFKFSLKENGAYNAYFGIDGKQEPEVQSIIYVNNEKYKAALLKLKKAKTVSEYAEILGNNQTRTDLGIFDSIFENCTDEDINMAAEYWKTAVEELSDMSFNNLSKTAVQSILPAKFNRGEIKNFDAYAKYVYEQTTEAAKYYEEKFGQDILKYMSGRNIQNLSEFQQLSAEALVIVNINRGDGNGIRQNILKLYADELGINTSNITEKMCSDLAKGVPYNDISQIQKFVNTYNSTSASSSGSGSGGSGGSGGVSGTSHTTVMPTQIEEVKTLPVFSDIADVEWAEEAITSLYYDGVINGKEENLFYPNDYVTREEFVKILIAAFNMSLESSEELPFEDVNEDDWFYPYVRTAYIGDIVNGISENRFGTGADITREDLCVMIMNLVNAGNINIGDGVIRQLEDKNNISDYARQAVEQLVSAGIVSGDEKGCFNPQNKATRAEAAKIIYYTLKKSENN